MLILFSFYLNEFQSVVIYYKIEEDEHHDQRNVLLVKTKLSFVTISRGRQVMEL